MPYDYYSHPDVRARLVEFLGGPSLDAATAMFVATERKSWDRWYHPQPTRDLWRIAASGGEIARSHWDRESLVAHLDMEYVNFDYPAEPYLHPARAFDVQRPVADAIAEILLQYGIAPLHVLSGRGHHFVWRVPFGTPAFAGLAKIGRVPPSAMGKYRQPQPPHGQTVSTELAAAFAGLGLVMEYVAHEVLRFVGDRCETPIELTAVEVGPIRRGREIVSIDLSEYGDPLHTRTTRMPYSVYLKPQDCQATAINGHAAALPPLFVIPLHEMDERQGLATMRDADEVVWLAKRASAQIPDQSAGTLGLVRSYRQSRLARFHDYFYAAEHDPHEQWPKTYDRTPLDAFPICVGRILRFPNDLLLKPAGIQHVARTLLAVGWHPRHIAGLIRSKFERDYGWGPAWFVYDAALRADFYTRLFSGLLATGLDPIIDYNCQSTREKGYCCAHYCGEILERHRVLLMNRTQAFQAELATDLDGDLAAKGQ